MNVPLSLPSYCDLPGGEGWPPRCSWGIFGPDDEVGTINLLSPERVVSAARLVRRGAVFPLNWSIDLPNPAILGRTRFRHVPLTKRLPDPGNDEYYDNFYPQSGTQWDSLKHVGHPQYGFYNGRSVEEITSPDSTRLGIHNWAERGIVGRFVLVDIDSHRRRRRDSPLDQTQRIEITVDEIDEALMAQRTALIGGDILLLRFGWISWYEQLDVDSRERLGSLPVFPGPGLALGEHTAEWLWDHHVAAVAADTPALEAIPFPDQAATDGFLHFRLISFLGMAVGEMFQLDRLAADSEATGTYDGLFTSAPMNKLGGAGSPANALAIR